MSSDDAMNPPALQDDALPAEMPAAEAPLPSYAKIGVTPADICSHLRVVDADTGEIISKVIEADADAGRVVRYAVENGALVMENDRFVTIEENRPIRMEWMTGKQRKNSF